jgi:hypothetical protein
MTINNKAKAEKLTKNQLECIKQDGELLKKHTADSIDLLNIINSLMAIYLQTQDGTQRKRFEKED